MKRHITLLAVIILALFSACGIEGFQAIPKLNPPLGVVASMSSNKIMVSFWSSNPETYLTGFNIYIADSIQTLKDNQGKLMPNSDGDPDKPTLWRNVEPSSNAVLYQIVFAQDNDNQPFQNNLSYFFMVRAYSSEYNLKSLPSNITNVTFLTN